MHPVITNSDIEIKALKKAKTNINRFHGVSWKMLNDVDSMFLALNKPMQDMWNNEKSFTHIPLDALFYSLRPITEVFIQGSLVSKQDKPRKEFSDGSIKTINFGFQFN